MHSATPTPPPSQKHFTGKFRPPLFDLSAGPVYVGGEGTLEVTDEGIRITGYRTTGAFLNLLLLAPAGIGLSWYVLHKFSEWGVSAGELFLTLGMTAVAIFVCLFVVAGMVLKPLVFKFKPVTHFYAWQDIQTIYPHPKPEKPIVIGVFDNYKRRRVHFKSTGPAYEVEAALTQHPKYTPIHMF